MDLTNCSMKLAIVYTSVSGNTEELAQEIYRNFISQSVDTDIYRIDEFPVSYIQQYDAVAIGTYTWGNGTIPKEMWRLYHEFESLIRKDMITAIFGTGDSCYPNYCGAVDQFRDMLYVHTNLAATLKVELTPQTHDLKRCQRFAESMIKRMNLIYQSI
jgi:flavodoxin I